MRRLLVAVLAAVALALAGCGPTYPEGPAGKVVDKDRDYKSSTKTYKYELTTRDNKGQQHEFRVSSSDYDDCVRGARYPKCTKD
ncbi:hypothetical protein [Streptomyces atriruber]|uniref:hypothetical protein n=1 Tax=Streptomyces atriruber TaxID=545121 RepID=UPI0006E2CC76|nr:hypothetical protein [Streptomyces atriruber]